MNIGNERRDLVRKDRESLSVKDLERCDKREMEADRGIGIEY
jgi:hypothetical protein